MTQATNGTGGMTPLDPPNNATNDLASQHESTPALPTRDTQDITRTNESFELDSDAIGSAVQSARTQESSINQMTSPERTGEAATSAEPVIRLATALESLGISSWHRFGDESDPTLSQELGSLHNDSFHSDRTAETVHSRITERTHHRGTTDPYLNGRNSEHSSVPFTPSDEEDSVLLRQRQLGNVSSRRAHSGTNAPLQQTRHSEASEINSTASFSEADDIYSMAGASVEIPSGSGHSNDSSQSSLSTGFTLRHDDADITETTAELTDEGTERTENPDQPL